MHKVDEVLAVLRQVLLRHSADGVRLIDDVVFAVLRVAPVYREVRPHHHAQHEALLLVLHGIHQGLALCAEGHEVALHRRIVHEADAQHTRVGVVNERLEDGNAVYCYDICHLGYILLVDISNAAKS